MEEINKEEFYEDKMNSFKSGVKGQVEDLLDEIVANRLPYLEVDREFNVEYRANDIVRKLLDGGFSISDDGYLKVDQEGFRISVKVSSNEWDNFRKSLIKLMPQCPKDREIESLKKQLKDSYERGY